jgi:NAD(P)-dependent dehydrogenase (short-subunit alcohol dehydrogenase family)
MEDIFSLKGCVALVTGAGQGNGQAIAMGLAAAGAKAIVTDLDAATAERTAAAINKTGGSAISFAVDVSDRQACHDLAKEIGASEGAISILVNNAGILQRFPFEHENGDHAWDRTFAVNVNGTYNMISAFLAALKTTRGCIINLGSIQSFVANPSSSAYTASKGAILLLTKALAVELAPAGVRVNAIAPGFMETPMTEATRSSPERMQALLAHTPMRRAGKPAELVGAVVFLASPAASYVTGIMLPVDGGYLAT